MFVAVENGVANDVGDVLIGNCVDDFLTSAGTTSSLPPTSTCTYQGRPAMSGLSVVLVRTGAEDDRRRDAED